MTALGVFCFAAQEGSRTIFLSCEEFIARLKEPWLLKCFIRKVPSGWIVQVDVLSRWDSSWHIPGPSHSPVFHVAGEELSDVSR